MCLIQFSLVVERAINERVFVPLYSLWYKTAEAILEDTRLNIEVRGSGSIQQYRKANLNRQSKTQKFCLLMTADFFVLFCSEFKLLSNKYLTKIARSWQKNNGICTKIR